MTKNKKKKTEYVYTVYGRYKNLTTGVFEDIRLFGIFKTRQQAFKVVLGNYTDLHENYYQTALLRRKRFGLNYLDIDGKTWRFDWDKEDKCYKYFGEIPEFVNTKNEDYLREIGEL